MKYLLALLALILATPAQATDWDHGLFMGNANYGPKQVEKERVINAYKPRPVIRHVERPLRSYMPSPPRESVVELRRPREPQVRGWVHYAKRQPDSSGCYPAIRTVGDQYINEEDAKKEAIKAWMQLVRHDLGEHAADPSKSDASFACVRSSIGSVLGQSYHRCEIIKRPCLARHEEQGK